MPYKGQRGPKLCTSQSLIPLAAAIPCTGRELLDLSHVSWRRYFQGNLFAEKKIVHCLISVPCTESLPRLPHCLSVLKPDLQFEFPASKESSESFDGTSQK